MQYSAAAPNGRYDCAPKHHTSSPMRAAVCMARKNASPAVTSATSGAVTERKKAPTMRTMTTRVASSSVGNRSLTILA